MFAFTPLTFDQRQPRLGVGLVRLHERSPLEQSCSEVAAKETQTQTSPVEDLLTNLGPDQRGGTLVACAARLLLAARMSGECALYPRTDLA